MHNHPDYPYPSNRNLFPAYGRRPIPVNNYEPHPYDGHERYQRGGPRLLSPVGYSQNPRPLGLSNDSLSDHPSNHRYDSYIGERERALFNDQRFSRIDDRDPLLNDRGLRDSLREDRQAYLGMNSMKYPSSMTPSHYARPPIPLERVLPFGGYSEREHFNQNYRSGIESSVQRDFELSSEDVCNVPNEKNFPSECATSPTKELFHSNSLSGQSSSQEAGYSNISDLNEVQGLSKQEKLLQEIRALKHQQKLKDMLEASAPIVKDLSHSPVLQTDEKKSSSNKASSPPESETFPHQLQQEFQKKVQNIDKSTTEAVFTTQSTVEFVKDYSCKENASNPPFDKLLDTSNNNIHLSDQDRKTIPGVTQLSSQNISNRLMEDENTDESTKKDQMPFDNFKNRLQKISEALCKENSPFSEENSCASESSNLSFIPFLGEMTDISNALKDFGLITPELQKVEQASNSAAGSIQTKSGENKKPVKSNLEDALEALAIMDPVVGLDFIIENTGNITIDGSFPFYCTLCKSSIIRSLIIDHILGNKHRLKLVKTKDESLYNYLMSPQIKQVDKEKEIIKAAQQMEKKYGRGRVVLQDKISMKDEKSFPPLKMSLRKSESIPGPSSFLSNEIDLEQNETQADAIIKKKNIVSAEDVPLSLATKVPTPIVKSPCHVSSPGSANSKFCNEKLSKNQTESPIVSAMKEHSSDQSPLKHSTFDNQTVTIKSEPNSPIHLNDVVFTNISASLKRPASPHDRSLHKFVKTEEGSRQTDVKSVDNAIRKNVEESPVYSSSLCGFQSPLPSVSTSVAEKCSLATLLEQMSTWEISSKEEAEMISKTVDVLLKMLLRYKLQQQPSNEMEKLLKSFLGKHLEISKHHLDLKDNIELNIETKDTALANKAGESTAVASGAAGNVFSNETDSLGSTTNAIESKTVPSASTQKPGLMPPPFFNFASSSTPTSKSSTTPMSWNSYGSTMGHGYHQQQGFGTMYQHYALPNTGFAPPVGLQMTATMSPPPSTTRPPLPPPPSTIKPPLPPAHGLPPPPPTNGPPPLGLLPPLNNGGPPLPPYPSQLPPLPPHLPPCPPPPDNNPPLPPLPSENRPPPPPLP